MTVGLFTADPERAVAARSLDLKVWLEKANVARQFAEMVADSAFVPLSYRVGQGGRPLDREQVVANATSAILLGDSLGVDPLTALQNIYIINGRPGMYTNFKIALLQQHGYEFLVDERSPQRCKIRGRKKPRDVHEETALPWTEVEITIEMARQADWTRNQQYNKVPADMLYARAGGRLCDMLDAAVLHGMATAEDLGDYDDDGFYEPDEPVRKIQRAFDSNPKGITMNPAGNQTTGGTKVADLINRSPDADARLADVVEQARPGHVKWNDIRDKHGAREITKEDLPPDVREALYPEERAENAGPPPVTPTERVRRRDAEKLGLGDDPYAGMEEAWPQTAQERRRREVRGRAEDVLPDPGGIDWAAEAEATVVTVEEATPQQWAEVEKGAPEEFRLPTPEEPPGWEKIQEARDWQDRETPEPIADDPATWPKTQFGDIEPEIKPVMIAGQRWDEINGLFNRRHNVNGEGSRAARYRVVKHVTGKLISKGSELTEAEGEALHAFLTEARPDLVRAIAYDETE